MGRAATTEDPATLDRRNPEAALAAVERRRWHLVGVSLVLLVLTATAVALLAVNRSPWAAVPAAPVLPFAFLAVAVVFSLYVVEQERELRRATRALLAEQRRAAELAARLDDLAGLSAAARSLNARVDLDDVAVGVLEAAVGLLGADDGAVLLVADDDPARPAPAGDAATQVAADGQRWWPLRVAVTSHGLKASHSQGGCPPDAPAALAEAAVGLAGWVAAHREPVLVAEQPDAAQLTGLGGAGTLSSAMSVPLAVADRLVGVLNLASCDPGRRFDQADLRRMAVFGEHAAVALVHASQLAEQGRSLARLAEADRRRSDLIAMVTHELKTPLTSVLGYLRLLVKRGDRVTDEQRADFYTNMERQGQRMLEMIEDLLQSSRLDEGSHALKREPLDLLAIAEQLQVDFKGKAPERTVEVAGHQADEVYGDRGAIEHVLGNLIDNALKYSPATGRVFISVEDLSSEVVVSVRDEGPGVPEAEVSAVFERFKRAQGSGPRGSVGLGLHIVKSLVAAHGGRVWCESPPGSGACFRFTLPRRTVRGAAEAAADTPAGQTTHP